MTELEQFLAEEEPVDESVTLKFAQPITLYKLDTKGKQRQWTITVVTDGHTGDIIIDTGLVEGKKVRQVISIDKGKNVGKANATTPATQALAEAQAKLEQQLRSGYVKDLADLKASGTLGSGLPQCLLAHKYSIDGSLKSSKTLAKMGLVGKKIYISPKLDGTRCLIDITNDSAIMYTRRGDIYTVQIPSILKEVIENKLRNFPQRVNLILDGELYPKEGSNMSFNELNGHLKRKDNVDLEKISQINYNIYDIMDESVYPIRYEMLKKFESEHVKVVPQTEIVATDENITEKLEEFLGQKFEGLMFRKLDMPYEHKRSWQLVKVKLFEDFEAKLLGIEEDSRGGGLIGGFILEMPTPTRDRDGKLITTFKAGVSGLTQEEQKDITKNIDKYIGNLATVECFSFSEYGVARFPKVKQLNRTDV